MRREYRILTAALILIAVMSLVLWDSSMKIYKAKVMNGDAVYKEKDVAGGDTFVLPSAPESTLPFLGWDTGVSLLQPGVEVTIKGDLTIEGKVHGQIRPGCGND